MMMNGKHPKIIYIKSASQNKTTFEEIGKCFDENIAYSA